MGTPASPPQELVPDDAVLFDDWKSAGWAFELWMYNRSGSILAAAPGGGFAPAAVVEACGNQLAAIWRGPITEQSPDWLNAQRAVAERIYRDGPAVYEGPRLHE